MSKRKFYRNKLIWVIVFYIMYCIVTTICAVVLNHVEMSFFSDFQAVGIIALITLPPASGLLALIFCIREFILIKRPSIFSVIALLAGIASLIFIIVDVNRVGHLHIDSWTVYNLIFTAVIWLCWIGDFIKWRVGECKKKKSENIFPESGDGKGEEDN